jgi:hypothetical protein
MRIALMPIGTRPSSRDVLLAVIQGVRPNPKLFCVSDDANSIQGVRPNPKLSCVSDDANSIRLSLLLGLATWRVLGLTPRTKREDQVHEGS